MKKFGFVMVLALSLGVAVTSCSSKENRADEPAISGSTGAESSNAQAANLGGSSSGQGR